MNSITQISVFDYSEIENLGDLEKLKIFFENIEDKELCEAIEKERKNGRNDYPVRTMLNLIYSGNDKVETNEIVVDATKDKWSNVYDFLAKDMTDKKIEKDRKLKILLAAEELFVNIASYAYEKDGKAWIKTEKTDTTYDISFIDTGKQYKKKKKKDPNVDISLEDRTEGGLGVYLVKKLVDEVIYRYENSQNIFTISINL